MLAALLLAQAAALQTYSSVKYGTTTTGCAPIESGGERETDSVLSVFAAPACLCDPTCDVAEASGRAAVALWSNSCSEREQAERLLGAGAKAVLLSVRYDGEFPTFSQLGISPRDVPQDVPMCTVSAGAANALRALAVQGGGDGGTVDVGGVARYNTALEEHPASAHSRPFIAHSDTIFTMSTLTTQWPWISP